MALTLKLPPIRTGEWRPGGHGPASGRCDCGWFNLASTNEAFYAHMARPSRQYRYGDQVLDLEVAGDIVKVPAWLAYTQEDLLRLVTDLGLRSISLHWDGSHSYVPVPLWEWDARAN